MAPYFPNTDMPLFLSPLLCYSPMNFTAALQNLLVSPDTVCYCHLHQWTLKGELYTIAVSLTPYFESLWKGMWHIYFLVNRSNTANSKCSERAGNTFFCIQWFHPTHTLWPPAFTSFGLFLSVCLFTSLIFCLFFLNFWSCFLLILPPYMSLASLSGGSCSHHCICVFLCLWQLLLVAARPDPGILPFLMLELSALVKARDS